MTTEPLRMVLDTDTGNEVDDQFALAYALLAPERLRLEAVYAAPFHNDRSSGPEDGMRQSYEEILRVFDHAGIDPDGRAFQGSTAWMGNPRSAAPSPAADDLVSRAQASHETLYVVAIGAPTNVASAIVSAPEIAERIVVVWLGGNPQSWPDAAEFNLEQDVAASRVLFDSGVALVHVPCRAVTELLSTTVAEITEYVRPAGRLGGHLAGLFATYVGDGVGRSHPLWDIGPIAYLLDPSWTSTRLVSSPVLTEQLTWSADGRRHLMREMFWLDRNAIFADLFGRLQGHAAVQD